MKREISIKQFLLLITLICFVISNIVIWFCIYSRMGVIEKRICVVEDRIIYIGSLFMSEDGYTGILFPEVIADNSNTESKSTGCELEIKEINSRLKVLECPHTKTSITRGFINTMGGWSTCPDDMDDCYPPMGWYEYKEICSECGKVIRRLTEEEYYQEKIKRSEKELERLREDKE